MQRVMEFEESFIKTGAVSIMVKFANCLLTMERDDDLVMMVARRNLLFNHVVSVNVFN